MADPPLPIARLPIRPITDCRCVLCPLADYQCRLPIADVFAIADYRFDILHLADDNRWSGRMKTLAVSPLNDPYAVSRWKRRE
jgi:hypothetical protein